MSPRRIRLKHQSKNELVFNMFHKVMMIILNKPSCLINFTYSRNFHLITNLTNESFQLFFSQQLELGIFSNIANTNIMFSQLGFLCACLQSSKAMFDEFFPTKAFEWFKVLFQVGLCWLISCSNSHCIILIVVCWRVCFVQVGSSFINSCN